MARIKTKDRHETFIELKFWSRFKQVEIKIIFFAHDGLRSQCRLNLFVTNVACHLAACNVLFVDCAGDYAESQHLSPLKRKECCDSVG